MKVTFNEVYMVVTFYYMRDGKRKQISKRFFQTLNPFNTVTRHPGSRLKTKDEIGKELRAEGIRWVVEMGKIHPESTWKWKANFL